MMIGSLTVVSMMIGKPMNESCRSFRTYSRAAALRSISNLKACRSPGDSKIFHGLYPRIFIRWISVLIWFASDPMTNRCGSYLMNLPMSGSAMPFILCLHDVLRRFDIFFRVREPYGLVIVLVRVQFAHRYALTAGEAVHCPHLKISFRARLQMICFVFASEITLIEPSDTTFASSHRPVNEPTRKRRTVRTKSGCVDPLGSTARGSELDSGAFVARFLLPFGRPIKPVPQASLTSDPILQVL